MNRATQRSVDLFVSAGCSLACAGLCDCRTRPSDDRWVGRALEGGGARVTIRGGTQDLHVVTSMVGRARDAGWTEVALRTPAIEASTPAHGQALKRIGVDVVVVPLYSQVSAVHDRISGVKDALVKALVGMRSFAEAGLGVEIEVPLLPKRLQHAAALVSLAHRAVPSLRAARFYLSRDEVPAALAPPSWDEGAPLLAEAIERCRELKVATSLRTMDAIPLCALAAHPSLQEVYRFNPKARNGLAPGCALVEACQSCAARKQCPGVTPSYAAQHGGRGLRPYAKRPEAMYEQRTSPRRKWTEDQKQGARKVGFLVLRPTVNCNQDCTFCSANETSNNVWTDPTAMLRQIARVARRGITRLSFSGGEPTLSKDLVSFVRTAKRLGVPEIELVTNAVLLDTPKRVEPLVQAGITHAFVSLHAHDESLSRVMTQKAGDFERTVKGVQLLLDKKIIVALNHVVNARNYRYLRHYVEFVREAFGGRVMISFAFVTPQYKALESIEQVPRLSDVMPYLKRALYRAVELGQPFIIGSRQGIPPCFLGEFRGWSDLLYVANEAKSEDAPQKLRAPSCDTCRYTKFCNGLWRPYAARYGTDEVKAWVGEPISGDELREVRSIGLQPPWGVPRSFDEVPRPFRDHEAEKLGPPDIVEPARQASLSLPVFTIERSRPVRIAVAGSGNRARFLARAAQNVTGFSIDAVASPHAPEADLREFHHAPRYRSALEAIEDIRPEGVIVATATHAHASIVEEALSRSIPVLCEKPLGKTVEESESVASRAKESGAALIPAHNDLFSTGLLETIGASPWPQVRYIRRTTPQSPDSLRLWGRSPLSETLYHALIVTARACGEGPAEVVSVRGTGEAAPQAVRLMLRYSGGEAEVLLDFTAPQEELSIAFERGTDAVTWRRQGREVSVTRGGSTRALESQGSEAELMLAHFRDVITGQAVPLANPVQAVDIQRTVAACIEALEATGVPFDRPNAPKHVSSRMPESRA